MAQPSKILNQSFTGSLHILWKEHIWPVLALGLGMGLVMCACIFAVWGTSFAGLYLIASTGGSFIIGPILVGLGTYYLSWRSEKEMARMNEE